MADFVYHSQNVGFSMVAGGTNPLNGEPFVPTDPFIGFSSPNKGLPYPNLLSCTFSGREVDYSISNLGSTKHTYTSPTQQDVAQLAIYFQDWGASYKISERIGNAFYILEVYIPWDDITGADFVADPQIATNWELTGKENLKSLIQSGLLNNTFAQPTQNGNFIQLPALLQIATQQAYDNNSIVVTPPSSSANFAPFIPTANQILSYMRAGVQSTTQYTQELTRTAVIDLRNVSNAFNLPIDNLANDINSQGTINYILSTNDMINEYDIPLADIGNFMLPSYSIGVQVVGIDPQTYFAYAGWKWTPETVQTIGRFKKQIKQTFIWDVWFEKLNYIFSPAQQFPFVYSPSANPNGYIP